MPFGCSIKLSWKLPPPSGCPITRYTVHYRRSAGSPGEKLLWKVKVINSTDHHRLWLECNEEYNIMVLAWNERGRSEFDGDSVLTVRTEKGMYYP